MKMRTLTLLGSLVIATAPALADELSNRAAVGGGLAGALGAFLGGELAGRNGAIIASGLSAAAGAAIATDGYERYTRVRYDDERNYCPPGQRNKGRC